MLASFIAKHRCSSSKQHEIPELHSSTLWCLIWSQILTAGSAFLPLTALLCITCPIMHDSWSYLFLPGQRRVSAFPDQAHLPATTALAHNPADTFHSSSRGDTFIEPTIPREASKSASPSVHSSPTLTTHITHWQVSQVTGKFPVSGYQPAGSPFDTDKMVFSPVISVKYKIHSPNQQQPWWLVMAELYLEKGAVSASNETTPLFPIKI